jgi:hypothetical protein
MGRAGSAELRTEWRARLARQATSGLSVAEFCRREGISAASYYHWRSRLAETCGPALSAVRESQSPAAPSSLAEVRFVQMALPTPQREDDWFELKFLDGAVLRWPSQNLAALDLALARLIGRGSNARPEEASHA